jgi:membrane fusion protein, copper/silver efflux system
MKNQKSAFAKFLLLSCSIVILFITTSCGQDHKNHNHSNMNMDKKQVDSSIVRTGTIDLQAIDSNKDGMVYQDHMDWNVISDEPGKCPLCKMTLKEVTIDEAKKNLNENGFEVKSK